VGKASPVVDAAIAERALTKATIRAADKLQLTNRTLGVIIGLSEPSISRMKRGDFKLERGQKSFELSVLFVRLYRSLDAIVSGDEQVAKAWLRNSNTALRGVPAELIQSISGLVNVIQYLDSRRAKI
jgi:Antitoxin Xre/MbcA/ParS C-terminal toxin-binding domain/Antitoxin Xre-like helix-turn-helix domain